MKAITLTLMLFIPVYVARQYDLLIDEHYKSITYFWVGILAGFVLYYFRKLMIYFINMFSPEGRLMNLKQDICELQERLKRHTPQTPGYNKNNHRLKKMKARLKELNTK
jgi:hypothetical protein